MRETVPCHVVSSIAGIQREFNPLVIYGGLMGSNGFYPLVNVYITMDITMENHHASLMGKSTISTGPFQ